jgi:hypothetical protein
MPLARGSAGWARCYKQNANDSRKDEFNTQQERLHAGSKRLPIVMALLMPHNLSFTRDSQTPFPTTTEDGRQLDNG